MRYLGTCDGNMQEGSLRADVNVSVRIKNSEKLGTRCEIKNVNSIKFMQMAIDYEANRQVDLIEEGKTINQETRLFDTKKNETRSMRSKEDAHDYRYFPDPDLLPLEVTDEFIEPCIIKTFNNEASVIQNDDVVICFNFRTDRPREITESLTQKSFPDQEMMPLKLNYFTFTNYNIDFKNIHVLFEKDNLKNTLGEVLSNNNKNQVRIAETEKYPHVTFFFNGGQEASFNKEKRILVNSPKVATYDLQPEMSAHEVKIKITKEMEVNTPDFFCLNFANPDMVGHTGVFKAITEAVKCVDECLNRIVELGKKMNYEFIIIADHGNADFAINRDGSPHTAHTLNPVPVVFVSDKKATIKKGILADIAPSILIRLGISIPEEMTGENLISIL